MPIFGKDVVIDGFWFPELVARRKLLQNPRVSGPNISPYILGTERPIGELVSP